MGLLLSILYSYVGAVELTFIVRDIIHQVCLHHEQLKLKRNLSKSGSPSSSSVSLLEFQKNVRQSIKSAQERLHETESIQYMADGVQYEQGYRVLSTDEQNLAKRWLETRASISIEPSLSSKFNSLENNCDVEMTAVTIYDQFDEYHSKNDSLCSSNLSEKNIIENRKINHQSKKNQLTDNVDDDCNDDELPIINFDEYSQDYLHALDGITKKGQRKIEETRRRKNYKMFTGGDMLQRHRSEDVDGETDNPWGELIPESFHDDNLWTRERATSIAENKRTITAYDEKHYQEKFKCELDMSNRTPLADNSNTASGENLNQKYRSELHGRDKADVSNENHFILNDSSEEIVPFVTKTIETIENAPEIFIDSSDIDDIIEDYDKIEEFMNSVQRIDDTDINKLQLKVYLEQPKPLKQLSCNYENDKDDVVELNKFSVLEQKEYETNNLANENQLSHFNSKRTINNLKENISATSDSLDRYTFKPAIRITPTEDERVEQFLYENCEQIDDSKHDCSVETLTKSKTTQFDCTYESMNEVESDYSLQDTHRESPLSDAGSDPIQFECNQLTNSNSFYNREDSSLSNKSNFLFKRSQSGFSELEYITGREDWRDSYDISEEFESDNYHHLRRHSEAADTLEYIRGREDWLKNRLHRNSLPKIFEINERKFGIQDEIDSDEYHHNFFKNEICFPFSTLTNQKKNPLNSNNTDDDKCNRQIGDYDKKLKWKINTKGDIVSNDIHGIISEWNDDDQFSTSKVDAPENIILNNSYEITAVRAHEQINTEDLVITVLDLGVTPDKETCNPNPLIYISEATDDSQDSTVEKISSPGTRENNTSDIVSSAKNSSCDIKSSCSHTFLVTEILNETRSHNHEKSALDLETTLQNLQQDTRLVRDKSERLDIKNFLNPNKQELQRTLSFENVEDLIRDVSLGPWFNNS